MSTNKEQISGGKVIEVPITNISLTPKERANILTKYFKLNFHDFVNPFDYNQTCEFLTKLEMDCSSCNNERGLDVVLKNKNILRQWWSTFGFLTLLSIISSLFDYNLIKFYNFIINLL